MRALILVSLLLTIPCGGIVAQAVDDDGGAPLRLRPGDAVRVQVGGESGFTCGEAGCEYPIDEEGMVLIPLVGLLRAGGVPFGEVRAAVRSRIAEKVLDPEVTVTPIMRVAVLGEIRQPGLLRVDPTYTVADVLAAAGGLAPDGDRNGVLLVREGSVIPVSLEGGGRDTSLRLRPGDQVVVGRRSWLSRNATAVVSVAGSVLAAIATSLILR